MHIEMLYRRVILLISFILFIFVGFSCWGPTSEDPIATENTAPYWDSTSIIDSCQRGDTLEIDLLNLVTDDELDSLLFSFADTTNIGSIDNSIYSLAISSSDTNSVYTCSILASDGNLADTASFYIKIYGEIDSNSAPKWSDSVFSYSIAKGEKFTINLNSISNDSDSNSTLVYTQISGNTEIDSIIDSMFTITANDSTDSVYTTEVVVSDGEAKDTAQFVFTVVDGNSAPQWTLSNYDFTISRGKTFYLNLDSLSSDANMDDTLTFSSVTNFSGIDSIVGNLYNISPNDSTNNPYSIKIVVTDGDTSDTADFKFNLNTKPLFSSGKPELLYEIEEGDSVEIVVEATDLDSLDTVIVGIDTTGSLPNSNTATFLNGVFKWKSQPSETGSYVITFYATDGFDTVKTDATIKVGKANIVPTIRAVTPYENGTALISEEDTLKVKVVFNDLDVADTLVVSPYLPTIDSISFSKIDDTSGVICFIPNYNTVIDSASIDLDSIKIKVFDGEDSAFYKLVVTVSNVNRAPVFNTDSPKNAYSVIVGNTLEIPFSATDADTEDVVDIVVDEASFKSGATISVVGNKIVWDTKIGDIGVDTISLSANDGEDVTLKKVVVSVIEDNTAPIITIDGYNSGDIITITEEGSVDFTVVATPAVIGDIVTISPVGTFNGASTFDSTTGEFTFNAAYEMATQKNSDTTFNFKFSAKGSGSQAVASEFLISINVTNVNRPITVTTNPVNGSVELGKTYSTPYILNDPDGDSIILIYEPESLDVSYDAENQELLFHANREYVSPNTSAIIKYRVTDGSADTTLQLICEVAITPHTWSLINTIPTMDMIAAQDSNRVFVSTTDNTLFGVTEYIGGGATATATSFSKDYPGGSYFGYQFNELSLVNNSLYFSILRVGGGGERRSNTCHVLMKNGLSETDRVEQVIANEFHNLVVIPNNDKQVSAYRDSVLERYIVKYDGIVDSTVYNNPCNALETSRLGSNIIYSSESPHIYQNLNEGSWELVAEPGVNHQAVMTEIEIASDYGDTIYAVGADTLFVSTNGRTGVDFEKVIDKYGFKIYVKKVKMLSGKVGWGIDKSDRLFFTNDGFLTLYSPNIGNTGVITDIVIAQDRKAIYVITDAGEIFRY